MIWLAVGVLAWGLAVIVLVVAYHRGWWGIVERSETSAAAWREVERDSIRGHA